MDKMVTKLKMILQEIYVTCWLTKMEKNYDVYQNAYIKKNTVKNK